jgi:hypothetical protein
MLVVLHGELAGVRRSLWAYSGIRVRAGGMGLDRVDLDIRKLSMHLK